MELKPGYKQTEVGVIPEDWEVVSIGSLASFSSGNGISVAALRQYSSDTPVPVYGGNGIAGYTNKSLVQAPVVVVGRVGQKCGEVYLTQGPAWITDNALYPRTMFRMIDIRFFALAMKAAGLNDVKNRNDLPLVTQSILHSVRIPFPPTLAEQQAIAEALSDVDGLISALDALIAKKRAIKQGAMQELLTGQRRLPGFAGAWEVKTLGEIGDKFLNGGTPSTEKTEYWQGEIPWITGADVVNQKISEVRRFITEEAVKNSSTNVVEKGNLLIVTRTGVGKIAVAPFDLAISQDLTGVYVKSGHATPEYLYRFFDYNSDKLKNLNQGTSIAGITRETLIAMKVILPSLPEQTAIAQILADMDGELAALAQKRDKTQALKQGMMQALLTGQTRLV